MDKPTKSTFIPLNSGLFRSASSNHVGRGTRKLREAASGDGIGDSAGAGGCLPLPADNDALVAQKRLAGPTTPKEAIEIIFTRFAEERQRNAEKAFQQLRQDISDHAHLLVPEVVAFDSMISNLIKIEEYLHTVKAKGGDTGKTATEIMADFLSTPATGDEDQFKVKVN